MMDRYSASFYIWCAAGRPSVENGISGCCRLCGETDSGVPFDRWVKSSFTNYDLLKGGSIICRACLFCCAEQSALLQQIKQRPRPQRMRTYSHFVSNNRWHVLTKGEKLQMRDLLAQSPTVAVIAESGQKHIIFRAKAGWWQFEEQTLLPCWEKIEPLLPILTALLSSFSKEEIQAGCYAQHRIIRFGVNRWDALDAQIRHIRLASHFQIALFLSQKEETED